MTPILEELCRRMGQQLASLLKCPDFPINQRFPKVRGVIGAVVLFPELGAEIPPGLKVSEEDLWARAYIGDEPLVELLGLQPILPRHIQQFTETASAVGLSEALSDRSMHNPVMIALGEDLARRSVATCLANGYDGKQAIDRVSHSTMLDRLRKQRRLLLATSCDGETYAEKVKSACNNLPDALRIRVVEIDGKKQELSRIRPIDLEPEIRSRPPNSWESYIRNHAVLEDRAVRSCLKTATEFETEELGRIPSLITVEKLFRSEARANKMPWRLVRHLHQEPYPIPASRGLGPAQLEAFVDEIATLRQPEHEVWAVLVFAFWNLDEIGKLQIFRRGKHWFTRRKVTPPQRAGNRRLCRSRAKYLILPLPRPVAASILRLRKEGKLDERLKAALTWAKIHFLRITLSRLKIALSTIGIHIYGLPWVLVSTALWPMRKKVASTRSYAAFDAQCWRRLEPYFRVADPHYETPRPHTKGCIGSGLCPGTQPVQSYFGLWLSRLDQAIITSDNVGQIVINWNVIAAGANWALRLTTGLRAYRLGPFLTSMPAIQEGEIFSQKSYFGTTICPSMWRLLMRCDERRRACEAVLRTAGCTIQPGGIGGAMSFMELSGLTVRYAEPGAAEIVIAHALDPEFRPFKDFAPNFFRHFAATVLREHERDEIDARHFLGHHPPSLSRFSLFSLEPIICRVRRFQFAEFLGEKAGLWP